MHKKVYFIFYILFPIFFLLSSLFYLLIPNSLFATTLSSTENLTISATVSGTTPTPDSGGGGGGTVIPETSVRFSGFAYPNAIVTVLKNGGKGATVKANSLGIFSITLEENYDNTILYTLFAKDTAGNKSLLINYPIVVSMGYLTHLSGILFSPTIVVDKVEVRKGDYLTVGGYALPEKEIEIIIEEEINGVKEKLESKKFTLTSPKNGHYNITLPLTDLPKGDYSVHTKYEDDARKSKLIKFIISDTNISSIDTTLDILGDCNTDGVINLIDFSVLAFWYKKDNPPVCVDTNKDKIVDLTDFSILAFYWTN